MKSVLTCLLVVLCVTASWAAVTAERPNADGLAELEGSVRQVLATLTEVGRDEPTVAFSPATTAPASAAAPAACAA